MEAQNNDFGTVSQIDLTTGLVSSMAQAMNDRLNFFMAKTAKKKKKKNLCITRHRPQQMSCFYSYVCFTFRSSLRYLGAGWLQRW